MHTRSALERLAAAGRPLLADADSLVDPGEEDRILDRILASGRPVTARRRTPASLRPALLLGAAILAGVVVSIAVVSRRTQSTTAVERHRSGRTIALAGYRFRLPAGYTRSSDTCRPVDSTPGRPMTVVYAVRAAASAEGGCLDVTLMAGASLVPPGAEAVVVGPFNGFLVAEASDQETLYLEIPVANGDRYLVLSAQGMTPAQLLAVARSGFPR